MCCSRMLTIAFCAALLWAQWLTGLRLRAVTAGAADVAGAAGSATVTRDGAADVVGDGAGVAEHAATVIMVAATVTPALSKPRTRTG